MAAVSSAQTRWDISLVGVTNIGDPGGIHTLDIQSSNVGAQSTASVSNVQFTGLDGTTVRIDGTYSAGTRTIDSLDGA